MNTIFWSRCLFWNWLWICAQMNLVCSCLYVFPTLLTQRWPTILAGPKNVTFSSFLCILTLQWRCRGPSFGSILVSHWLGLIILFVDLQIVMIYLHFSKIFVARYSRLFSNLIDFLSMICSIFLIYFSMTSEAI